MQLLANLPRIYATFRNISDNLYLIYNTHDRQLWIFSFYINVWNDEHN